MSYIPDYRHETDKLNEVDRAGVAGFRIAVESALALFDNLFNDALSIIEKDIAAEHKEQLEAWLEVEEIEFVCSLFDNADYLPDDIELKDGNVKE